MDNYNHLGGTESVHNSLLTNWSKIYFEKKPEYHNVDHVNKFIFSAVQRNAFRLNVSNTPTTKDVEALTQLTYIRSNPLLELV